MAFAQTHAAICLALACLVWLIQLVVYPAFKAIDPVQFGAWHLRYTTTVTRLIGPLILLQTGGVAVRRGSLTESTPLWIAECTLTLLAWLATGAISVPLHRKLQKERSERLIHILIQTNWIRTIAWTGTAILSWIATYQ